mgnify:CR=1 FL=1
MRFWPAAVRESPIPPGGKNPSPGRSDAFREPFPASTRQSLPMVASSGPGVVRGGVWLQYRALVVVIYVFTAPVRRFFPRSPHASEGAEGVAVAAVGRAFSVHASRVRTLECVRSIGPP